MNKKVMVLALTIVIALSFTACKSGSNEDTTTTLSATKPMATTAEQMSNKSAPVAATMILTSANGETMPTVVTTAFDLSKEASTDPIFEFPTADITPVNPDTSQIVQPILPSVSVTEPSNATEPSDATEPTEKTTSPQEVTVPENQRKYINAEFEMNIDRKGNCIYDVYPDGWDENGGIKANSTDLIIVEVNGKQKVVRGSIVGKADSAGNYKLTVQTSDLNLKDGDMLNITIPRSFLVSKDGTRFSEEINTTATYEITE